jgi:predicted transcriptional regulator
MKTTKLSSLRQFLIHTITVLALFAPVGAFADVVYTTLPGVFSSGAAGLGNFHYAGIAFRTPPGQPYAIDSVRLNLWNNTNVPDPQFVVELYDDNAGVPGSLVATIGTGTMDPTHDVLEVATPAAPVALTPDTVYWIMAYSPGNAVASVSWFGGGVSPAGSTFPHVRGPVRWVPSTSFFDDITAVGNLHVEINASLTAATPTYSVEGTVTGLTALGLVLQINGGDDLDVFTNGNFFFSGTMLDDGSAYAVTVLTNPPGQTCSVTNGSGTISGANVTDVIVNCADDPVATYSVGGTVSGLTGSVTLQNNVGDDIIKTTNDGFTFTAQAEGSDYAVTVSSQPTGQTCTVTNGSGTNITANITNVTVTCVTDVVPTYTVGGTVSGLIGSVTLYEDTSGEDLALSTNGSFAFATEQVDGTPYAVTVLAQPTGQTCSVTNGSGTITTADVTNVSVACIDDVVAPPPVPMVPIPTLSEWALILLTMLLGLMVFANRRRLF